MKFLRNWRRRSARSSRGAPARAAAPEPSFRLRAGLVAGVVALAAGGLAWRAVDLQFVDSEFLRGQGDERHTRVMPIAAHRGTVTDRFGEPLAMSTPVDSLWANPKELALAADDIPLLAKALKRDRNELTRRVTSNLDRRFLYLARHMQPSEAAKIKALGIPGVYTVREYRRYYPSGEVAGHILGFTNVDDGGQEGLELAFEHRLAGEDGAKRVIQDNLGRVVQDIESIRAVRPGRDLPLSIDLRIQYLAYRELKAAIREHRAKAGSVVVLDVTTGEVLAMVNQPTYNPNDRLQIKPVGYRNRAVTDIIEPGSSIKPFIVAAALASGKYDDHSVIDTSPGFIKVGIKIIEDKHNLGAIDLSTVLAKSSNVAMARLALDLEPGQIHDTLTRLGFGQVTSSSYPGESAGSLAHFKHWRPISIASLSYGYGLSVTPLQLAHAYATLGSLGVSRPVTFERVDAPVVGQRVLDPQASRQLLTMLEAVVNPSGTGQRASVHGYRVAGKTGTAWKASLGGYATDKYLAVFGGVAPASNPRLAAVVVIDEPSAGAYYAGEVAAPVFSGVVGGALRLLAVAPDAPIVAPTDEMPSMPAPARTPDESPVTAARPSANPLVRR